MRYGLSVASTPPFEEPRHIVRIAQSAEAAGWDALLLWDHLAWVNGTPSCDPWVALAACAQATERIVLGTGVTPLPRRRPHVVAHELATLDRLSGGRALFGAGLGGDERELSAFGEPTGARGRAALLDEGLEVVSRLLSGRPVKHRGAAHTVDGVALSPPPVHRIPIWIGGSSPAALRRAARWDGWLADGVRGGGISKTPQEIAESVQAIRSRRAGDVPFDVAFIGYSEQAEPAAYAAAGASWWFEPVYGRDGALDRLLDRVAQGPPSETER